MLSILGGVSMREGTSEGLMPKGFLIVPLYKGRTRGGLKDFFERVASDLRQYVNSVDCLLFLYTVQRIEQRIRLWLY